MKKINFYNLFYLFIIGSVFGWAIEGIYTLIKKGLLINHSALVIGPFNIVYGLGAVLLSIVLSNYKDKSYLKIFIISFIFGTILEYVLSLLMEFFVGFTAWDYSQKILNINGRVSLIYSIYWGILGVFWIKWVYPFIIKYLNRIDINFSKSFVVVMSIFLIFNTFLTFSAINRAREFDKGILPSNSFEKFLDNTFNGSYLKNMFNNNWK